MGESLLESNNGLVWHNHDIYEGAGGDVRHAHPEGDQDHAHSWAESVAIDEFHDTFLIEASRLRAELASKPDDFDEKN